MANLNERIKKIFMEVQKDTMEGEQCKFGVYIDAKGRPVVEINGSNTREVLRRVVEKIDGDRELSEKLAGMVVSSDYIDWYETRKMRLYLEADPVSLPSPDQFKKFVKVFPKEYRNEVEAETSWKMDEDENFLKHCCPGGAVSLPFPYAPWNVATAGTIPDCIKAAMEIYLHGPNIVLLYGDISMMFCITDILKKMPYTDFMVKAPAIDWATGHKKDSYMLYGSRVLFSGR